MTTRENMLRLMCLPLGQFADVVRTADGYYIGRIHGDLGYNAFLGRPNSLHDGTGRAYMLDVWGSLSDEEKIAVHAYARNPIDGAPILLHADFGVPEVT